MKKASWLILLLTASSATLWGQSINTAKLDSFLTILASNDMARGSLLDPKTEELIFETKTVNTTFSWDVNTKRGVIEKIVNKKIKKLFKE